MTTRSERLNRLTIASPCQESWQTMSGGEQTRFCMQCQKHVYDLAALEAREVEALIEATQGRLCARITRDRFGRMVTREPDPLPFQRLIPLSVRRTSPVVAAVVTAVVGMTGAGWAQETVSPPAAAAPVSPDLAHPSGPGEAALEGQAVDVQGIEVLLGEMMVVDLSLDEVFQQSRVVVAATVGRSETLEKPSAEGGVVRVRTELRVTSVFKGKPRGGTLQIEHHVLNGHPEPFRPGDVVLAFLTPLKPGNGRPTPLVYASTDPFRVLHPLPADPRLRPELGIDGPGWRALSYIASATDDGVLQELVTLAIKEVEKERQHLATGASGEKRLRARTAAIEEDLRFRFIQVLGGGG